MPAPGMTVGQLIALLNTLDPDGLYPVQNDEEIPLGIAILNGDANQGFVIQLKFY